MDKKHILKQWVDHTLLKHSYAWEQTESFAGRLNMPPLCAFLLLCSAGKADFVGISWLSAPVTDFPNGNMNSHRGEGVRDRDAVKNGATKLTWSSPSACRGTLRPGPDEIRQIHACGGRCPKVNIETPPSDRGREEGKLRQNTESGADFTKTSTGFFHSRRNGGSAPGGSTQAPRSRSSWAAGGTHPLKMHSVC